jgi:hypothetical protein
MGKNLYKLEKKNIEFHIPGYQFCGPGTKVFKRLKRGDKGINKLDEACKLHDIQYLMYAGNNEEIKKADKELRNKAQKIGGIAPYLVDKIFFFKSLGERMRLWSPAKFANMLSKKMSINEQRIIGKLLYEKYIKNENIDIENILNNFPNIK